MCDFKQGYQQATLEAMQKVYFHYMSCGLSDSESKAMTETIFKRELPKPKKKDFAIHIFVTVE